MPRGGRGQAGRRLPPAPPPVAVSVHELVSLPPTQLSVIALVDGFFDYIGVLVVVYVTMSLVLSTLFSGDWVTLLVMATGGCQAVLSILLLSLLCVCSITVARALAYSYSLCRSTYLLQL